MAGCPRTLVLSSGAGRSEGEAREPELGGLPDCSPSPTLAQGPMMSWRAFQAPPSRVSWPRTGSVSTLPWFSSSALTARWRRADRLRLSLPVLRGLHQVYLSPQPLLCFPVPVPLPAAGPPTCTLTSGPSQAVPSGQLATHVVHPDSCSDKSPAPNGASQGLVFRQGWLMRPGSDSVRTEGGEDRSPC